ncbi:calcium proton exchanger [Raphidocelis subcapitata]|uniref:Calcium proton exchanger n=1 Tax=Raphidocelis subcapitata TaxID=307507 RepID=A0A2V0PJV6_9CHLO|nr:calcium proton exchanger [Raphidocelis subcapitata]|eukprot:GBG00092.1 calcium proton exchanger [Raphidocelis subcapitata]
MANYLIGWLGFGAAGRGSRRSCLSLPSGNVFKQLWTELRAILLGSKMNALLLLMPFAFASHAVGWPSGATFMLALLPLCALAERLGMITEQLAMYTNDSVGGLLNATFGNATEVIIAAFAISRGYLRVVKLTLLGSIVSNLLLVMGSAFIAGGVLHPMQHYNQRGINVNCGLLLLSVVSIALPTLLSSTSKNRVGKREEVALSRFESLLMLVGYATFLVFQLVTHKFLYEGDLLAGEAPAKSAGSRSGRVDSGGACSVCGCVAGRAHSEAHAAAAAAAAAAGSQVEMAALNGAGGSRAKGPGEVSIDVPPGAGGGLGRRWNEGERLVTGPSSAPAPSLPVAARVEEEDEECVLSLWGALFWLGVVTVLISFLSDAMMAVINEASVQLKVPMPFLTTIIVPIVGNAAEHASALVFAVKNRMEVALGVAVGSSTQIGVLVIPFCVVLAWCMGQPLDLNFNEFEAAVLFISVLLAVVVLQDGTSNYLKGLMLVITYAFIGAGFWLHKDPELREVVDGTRH